MNIKPIKNIEDYNSAINRLEDIFDAPINSIEGDEAEILSTKLKQNVRRSSIIFLFFNVSKERLPYNFHVKDQSYL